MQTSEYVVLVSRWIHLATAIVLVGGAAFMRFALIPSAAEVLDDATHRTLREAIRKRWAKIVHIGIALLLVTGGTNFVLLAIPPKIHPIPYHPIFGAKLLAALAIFFLATALVGRSPGLARIRENSRKSLNMLLGLAAFIVVLSGVLHVVRLRDPGMTARSVAPGVQTP